MGIQKNAIRVSSYIYFKNNSNFIIISHTKATYQTSSTDCSLYCPGLM